MATWRSQLKQRVAIAGSSAGVVVGAHFVGLPEASTWPVVALAFLGVLGGPLALAWQRARRDERMLGVWTRESRAMMDAVAHLPSESVSKERRSEMYADIVKAWARSDQEVDGSSGSSVKRNGIEAS